jgi:hypothetical protein
MGELLAPAVRNFSFRAGKLACRERLPRMAALGVWRGVLRDWLAW